MSPLEAALANLDVAPTLGRRSAVSELIPDTQAKTSAVAPIAHPNGKVTRVFEKAWHRVAAYMFAAGARRQAVAKACGVNPASVTLLWRDPVFRQQVADIIAETHTGEDSMLSMMKAAGQELVLSIMDLALNPNTPPTVKLNAANSVLDRVMGKAPIKVEPVDSGKSDEASIAALKAKAVALTKDLNLNRVSS